MDLLNYLGQLHRDAVEPGEARTIYEEALALASHLGNRSAEATTLNGLAQIHRHQGNVTEALDLYARSRRSYEQLKWRSHETRVLGNMGNLFMSMGKVRNAMDSYNSALAVAQTIDSASMADAVELSLNGIGWIHHLQGEFPEAIRRFDQVIELGQRFHLDNLIARGLNRKGIVYGRHGRTDEALEALSTALSLFAANGDQVSTANVKLNIARLLVDREKAREALDLLNGLLPYFQEAGYRDSQVDALYISAKAYRQLGEIKLAMSHIESGLEKIESLRAQAPSPGIRLSLFKPRERYYGFYIDLLMDLDKNNPEKRFDKVALSETERTRARSLADLLHVARTKIEKDVNLDLLKKERSLMLEINQLEEKKRQLLQQETSAASRASIERDMRGHLLQYEKIQGDIIAHNPSYSALMRPQSLRLTASAIQDLLDPDTVLLAYILGDTRSFLWRVDQDSVIAYPLPERAQIESEALMLYKALADGHQRALTGKATLAAKKLSETILSDVSESLDNQRIVVIGDGPLQYIPFSVLPKLPASTPLIVDHEIVHLPSMSVLKILRRANKDRAKATKLIAILADPVFQPTDERFKTPAAPSSPNPAAVRSPSVLASDPASEQYRRLRHSKIEAEAILNLVPKGQETFTALNFDANRETVLQGTLRPYRIVHFATHGRLDTEHPELSAIVLSQVDEKGRPRNGFLRLHEIYNLDLSAELVVLSACRTALGQDVRGEGLVGLTRGFMYAGASRVLVSLWNVNDQATAELMTRFYRAFLQDGQTPAAALRQAQLSIRNERRFAAPYFWAAFVLQGDWR